MVHYVEGMCQKNRFKLWLLHSRIKPSTLAAFLSMQSPPKATLWSNRIGICARAALYGSERWSSIPLRFAVQPQDDRGEPSTINWQQSPSNIPFDRVYSRHSSSAYNHPINKAKLSTAFQQPVYNCQNEAQHLLSLRNSRFPRDSSACVILYFSERQRRKSSQFNPQACRRLYLTMLAKTDAMWGR